MDKKLFTWRYVQGLKTPGRYADAGEVGLYLNVSQGSSGQLRKSWLWRGTVNGKRQAKGLGSIVLTSLEDARQEARRLRKLARSGQSLNEAKKVAAPTLMEVAEQHFQHKESTLTVTTYRQNYVRLTGVWFSACKNLPIDAITSRHIVQALNTPLKFGEKEPRWHSRAVTAQHQLRVLSSIFKFALAMKYVTANPCETALAGLGDNRQDPESYKALDFDLVPAFIKALRAAVNIRADVKAALELKILTCLRSSDLLGARFDEFDMVEKIWTVPASRLKGGKRQKESKSFAHTIPLSDRAVALVEARRADSSSDVFLFPNRKGQPFHHQALVKACHKLGAADKRFAGITAHGFRSTLYDWGRHRGVHDFVIDRLLHHVDTDKVAKRYRRDQLHESRYKGQVFRKEALAMWAAHCEPNKTAAGIVSIRRFA